LELLDDPNNITGEKADLNRFLNQIQIDFQDFIQRIGDNGAEVTRIEYMFGRTYINVYEGVNSNTLWNLAYQGMFSDMKEATAIAMADEEDIQNKHIGVMQVLKAYTLMTLVDFYGDIPLSEATNPSEFPFPHVDDDATVYAAAIQMLDDAIVSLNGNGANLENDFYYDNDFTKWVRLANTLKMSAYLNTRLVDANAMSKFNAIVNSGNYISENSQDFEFRFGTSTVDPDTRHPLYAGDYQATGACGGCYRSNWIMDTMNQSNDPRTRYYFYRQTTCVPGGIDAITGETCAPDQSRLTCSTQSPPAHYPAGMIYCFPDDGYWGRDHGNAEGIPPDNLRRAVVGVYPAGGKFDENDFSAIGEGLGGQGAGITPIMLASWVEFMRAEMALASGDAGAASGYLNTGLTKHINKVRPYFDLDPDADSEYAATQAEVDAFIDGTVASFNGADMNGKWDILAIQQFISHYGNGIGAYNMYRRTGYPVSLQYNVESGSGPFIRSFLYASSEADTNPNIPQKPNVNVQVFWDNNPPSGPAGTAFPFAN
jgi:hypothetical protein